MEFTTTSEIKREYAMLKSKLGEGKTAYFAFCRYTANRNRMILTFGYDLPSNDSNVYRYWDYFCQCISLSDYDIVVIKPSLGLATTPLDSLYYLKNEIIEYDNICYYCPITCSD